MKETKSRKTKDTEQTRQALEEKLIASLINNMLSCATAFKIAEELKVSRRAAGETADRLGVRIVNCQLGCFPDILLPYAEAEDEKISAEEKAARFQRELIVKEISPLLEEKITSSLIDGKLSCPVAFKIAQKLKIAPLEVGKAADNIGIRMSSCQLGCFP